MERILDIFYDKLIVGISLDALRFSVENNIPIISMRNNKPTIFNFDLDESDLIEYNKLCYELSMKSLIVFSSFLFSLRLDDDNTLIATTNSNILIKIKFNTLFIADDYKLEGLPPITGKTSDENFVIDFFAIQNCKYDRSDNLKIEDRMIKNIVFYRKNNFRWSNDCYSVSYIKDKNLNDFEFSQTYAKIKITSLLEELGFKKVKLISEERIIKPLGKNIYEDLSENINIL